MANLMYCLEFLFFGYELGCSDIFIFCDNINFSVYLGKFFQVPMARASILWLLGEYSERVPKVAPDVLRKMAKTFGTEVS